MKIFRLSAALLFGVLSFGKALADSFVIQNIDFRGLSHIQKQTALSYLPIHVGQEFTDATSISVISSLYKTGFFSDVQLFRQGNTLVIQVVERPVISQITLIGNKAIPSKQLFKVLKNLKVAEGYEYNQNILQGIKSALISQYDANGKYNARVDINVEKLTGNRVGLTINISEGLTATIQEIQVIGNHAFSEKTLLKQFSLKTSVPFFEFWNNDNQYSSQKLEGDLETLRSYYLDRGYIHFKLDSTQVALSPDRKHVYIAVTITEGDQYKFGTHRLTGNLILPEADLEKRISFHAGDIFSNAQLVASEKSIISALSDQGYARAKVDLQSSVDEKTKTVNLVLTVEPGRRVYVRHINFIGKDRTNDRAFRRVLTQFEGGYASEKQIQNSKTQLLQMPFVRNVEVTTTPVKGTTNQEDVNFKVDTAEAGEVKAGVGYSDEQGFLVNASLNQSNVLGTGNAFNVGAQWSQTETSLNLGYFNPYYTTWGVGRGYNLYADRYNGSHANIANYTTSSYGGLVNYVIPISQNQSLTFGYGIDATILQLGSDVTQTMLNFRKKYGKDFYQAKFNLGWSQNSLDRIIFPTTGWNQGLNLEFSAPFSHKSLEYYKVTYSATNYLPLYQSFILKTRAQGGYGNGYGRFTQLPFFENFFTGGIGSVRGYEANTIGPQDSDGNALGGNILVDGSAAIIFPNPISQNLRTSWFVDAGNVFDTQASGAERRANEDRYGLRYSTGLGIDWLSPFGMLNFSIAKAINPSHQDSPFWFQFNIGTTF